LVLLRSVTIKRYICKKTKGKEVGRKEGCGKDGEGNGRNKKGIGSKFEGREKNRTFFKMVTLEVFLIDKFEQQNKEGKKL
jgi:hypothetical protein